jgi:hypothetical protein
MNTFKHSGFLVVSKNGANRIFNALIGVGSETKALYSLLASDYGLTLRVSSMK